MQVRVESIGLGVPGGVLPDRGQFDRAVEGVAFRPNEFVARSLAARLHSVCGAGLLETVLGVEDTNALASVIHLDNDARCAARWLITDRGPTWRNFACVFAGSGLGSGLVFDRSIFYGSSFRAGEVGHVNLNMSDHLLIGGADIKPRLCSCGVRGYHYESLVNIGGIGHLAQAMDAEMLAVLRESYTADEDRAARLRMRAVDADDAAGMILLRTLSASGYGLPDGASARPEIGDYLARVARQYGELFSVGLIAILDALDVEHVALCGTIPEALQGNRDFIRTLDERIAGSVLGAHTPTTFGDMGYWGWRGAALLPRDPGYVARRFPVEAAQGVLPG
jgi:predicted NBD/HSP70 family sugar kinase